MRSFFQLVYVSSAANELSEAELGDILEKSRIRNAAEGVTGMLIYSGGNILQVLEGSREAVIATYLRIERDGRHRGIIRLLQSEAPERCFPEWSMGFKCLAGSEIAEIPGYRDLQPLSEAEREGAAHKLIRHFMRHMVGVG